MPKRSKRYREMAKKLPKDGGPIELSQALEILKKFATTKFDQSVETAMRLGIDPRQADQLVRGAISLPAGIGKTVRVAVFAKGEQADRAKEAGADEVGAEDLAAKIKDGWTEFDIALATPDMMRLVGPLGKVLGPRGLMPTPKNGTVTTDVGTAVSEFKAGKIEYRNDSTGNLHVLVGKLSFSVDQLRENIETFVQQIRNVKPHGVKGTYIQSITVSATMSPGIAVTV